ncbi:putative sterigmatocystin 8-O-methyltransferase precursor [Thozetella sp. PMI_491]|nr:putative sterigmatocystin 8-O-methyltransferase precursor [Thozetella sp. PMI_491]
MSDEHSVLEATAREALAAAKLITGYYELNGIKSPSFGADGGDATALRQAPVNVREARDKLLGATAKLHQLIMDPTEYLPWLAVQYQLIASVQWLAHFQVLSAIPLTGSADYEHVARLCNVPVRHLLGFARMAMTTGFLCEPAPGKLAHTPASRNFAANHAAYTGWTKFMTGFYMPVAAKSAEATQKWGQTDDQTHTAANLAMNMNQTSFDFITGHRELGRLFSGYMKGVYGGVATNVAHVVHDLDWASVGQGVVVHIDGAPGSVAVALAESFPRLRFVVQDSPETLGNSRGLMAAQPAHVRERIQTVAADRFTVQQPRPGPVVYIIRMTLHNHSDSECQRILNGVLPAMRANPEAKLLIVDTVLSDVVDPNGNPAHDALERYRDLVMFQVFATKERHHYEFEELLASVADAQGRLVIEAVRKQPGSTLSALEIVYRPN